MAVVISGHEPVSCGRSVSGVSWTPGAADQHRTRAADPLLPVPQHVRDRPADGLSGAFERRGFHLDVQVVDSINDAHPPPLAVSAEHRAGVDR